jgi:hypothetical protein
MYEHQTCNRCTPVWPSEDEMFQIASIVLKVWYELPCLPSGRDVAIIAKGQRAVSELLAHRSFAL